MDRRGAIEAWTGGAIVTAVALALRVAWVGHGLPRTEAGESWIHLFSLLDRSVGAHFLDALAKGAHTGLLHLGYLGLYLVERIGGAVPDYAAFATGVVASPGAFLTLARDLVAAAGAATVLVLFRHGRAFGGTGVGLVAALFLAVAAGHVEASRRVAPEAVLALATFWTLTHITEAAEGKRRFLPWAFVLLGGAAARGGWAGILLLGPVVMAFARMHGVRRLLTPTALLPAVFAAGLAGLAAAAPEPPAPQGAGGAVWAEVARGGIPALVHAGRGLWSGFGPALLLLSTVGAVIAVHLRREFLPHVIYIALVILGVAAGLVDTRAAIVVLPALCLLAAVGLAALVEWTGVPSGAGAVILAAAAFVTGMPPALASRHLLRSDHAVDTRATAAEWITENLPDRAVVEIPADPQHPWMPEVLVPDLKRNMKKRAERVLREDPDGFRYWQVALRVDRGKRFDVVFPEGDDPAAPVAPAAGAASDDAADEPASGADTPRFAVVDPAAEEPRGEVLATFLPEWPGSKGPPLEVRRLAVSSAAEGE